MQSSPGSTHSSPIEPFSAHLKHHNLLGPAQHFRLTGFGLGFVLFLAIGYFAVEDHGCLVELFEYLSFGFVFVAGDEVESEGVF